jgi:hypothetical protein
LCVALDDEALRNELREAYAIWNLHIEHEDPDVARFLRDSEKRDEDTRRKEFDAHLEQFRSLWHELRDSATLSGFETLRDKVIAHNEVRHHGSTYRAFDIASLGLKFGDLRQIVEALEPIVDRANLLFRAASFAFDDSACQMRAASEQFWYAAPGT